VSGAQVVDTAAVALTDLGGSTYHGYGGGLYPSGANEPPDDYLAAGLAAAKRIVPRGRDGAPRPDGAIGLLSIGMSNTTQEYAVFQRQAERDPAKGPRVVIVDGAQGAQDAPRIVSPDAPYWRVVDERLGAAGLTPAQVQAVWLKQAIAGPTEPFPADAQRLQGLLGQIVDLLRDRFAALQVVYVSSRTYAGFATTPLNPEPYAYQSGFAVKWLIEERIAALRAAAEGAGQADAADAADAAPWVGWGPYLWTAGTAGRADGLVWTPQDVAADGTHPSPLGARKVAEQLLAFFKTDPTAHPWFTAG